MIELKSNYFERKKWGHSWNYTKIFLEYLDKDQRVPFSDRTTFFPRTDGFHIGWATWWPPIRGIYMGIYRQCDGVSFRRIDEKANSWAVGRILLLQRISYRARKRKCSCELPVRLLWHNLLRIRRKYYNLSLKIWKSQLFYISLQCKERFSTNIYINHNSEGIRLHQSWFPHFFKEDFFSSSI